MTQNKQNGISLYICKQAIGMIGCGDLVLSCMSTTDINVRLFIKGEKSIYHTKVVELIEGDWQNFFRPMTEDEKIIKDILE